MFLCASIKVCRFSIQQVFLRPNTETSRASRFLFVFTQVSIRKRVIWDPPLLPFASSVAPGVIQNQTQIPPCVVYRCDSSGEKVARPWNVGGNRLPCASLAFQKSPYLPSTGVRWRRGSVYFYTFVRRRRSLIVWPPAVTSDHSSSHLVLSSSSIHFQNRLLPRSQSTRATSCCCRAKASDTLKLIFLIF